MARPSRLEFPGALCYVTTRGNVWGDSIIGNRDWTTLLALHAHLIDWFR
ncbi:MAG: hypothetical protein ACT4PN_17370 [Nitrospiraceae bacterium]